MQMQMRRRRLKGKSLALTLPFSSRHTDLSNAKANKNHFAAAGELKLRPEVAFGLRRNCALEFEFASGKKLCRFLFSPKAKLKLSRPQTQTTFLLLTRFAFCLRAGSCLIEAPTTARRRKAALNKSSLAAGPLGQTRRGACPRRGPQEKERPQTLNDK